MPATIQKILKPTKYRAVDTSTSIQETVNIILDGEFTENVSEGGTGSTYGWSCADHWAINSGTATCTDDTGAEGNLSQGFASGIIENGVTYRVTFTVSGINQHGGSGGFRLLMYDGDGNYDIGTLRTTDETFIEDLTIGNYTGGTLSSNKFIIQTYGDPISGSIDNVSVVRLESFGNNNHGQIYSGRALEFDGVGDRFATTGGGTYNTPSTEVSGVNSFEDGKSWTLAVWMYLNGRQDCYVIGKDQSTRPHIFLNSDSSIQYLEFRAEDTGNDYYRFGLFPENTWHRLVVTSNGTTISAYSNGALIGTITDGMASTDSSGSFTSTEMWFSGWGVAYESGGNYGTSLDGMMSDAQVWDVEWTQSDITYDYLNPESLALNNGGTSLTESNLKLWYPMQDGHRGQQSYILDGANTGLGDEVLGDPEFNTDVAVNTAGTYWTTGTVSDSGWSISGGKAIQDGSTDGGADNFFKTSSTVFVTGVTYKITLDVTSTTAGALFDVNDINGTVYSNVEAGTTTFYFTAGGNRAIGIDAGSGKVFDINSISIKPVNDKHHATTVFYGDELLANVDMETSSGSATGGGTAIANWSDFGTPAAREQSTTQAHGGSNSCKFTVNAEYEGIESDAFTVVAGRTYYLSCEVYPDDTTTVDIRMIQGGGSTTLTQNFTGKTENAWNTITTTFVCTQSGDGAHIVFSSPTGQTSGSWYIDDVTFKEQGTATGWTDADQQLDIPQTALQSYNQLAWFDGQSGADATLDSQINTGGSSWSFSFWLFNKDTTKSFDFIIGSSGNRNLSVDNNSDRKLYYRATDNAYYALSDAVIPQGEWVHIVVTASGDSNILAYINGEVQTTNSSMSDTELLVDRFMEGYTAGGGYESLGSITEIAYYDARLTLANVLDLYNDGKAKSALEASGSGDLVGYWRNNGIAEWKDLKGSNDVNTNNVVETLLLPAGVDASRDNQGFLMNRQKDTNSLNLCDVGDITDDNTKMNYIKLNNNPLANLSTSNHPFSISVWVKNLRTQDNDYHGIITCADTDDIMFGIGVEAGEDLNIMYDADGLSRGTIASGSVVPLDTWTHIVVCYAKGADTASSSHATVLTDGNAAFDVDELIGAWLHNIDNTEYGTVTDNDATTITCGAGGFDHDSGDKYHIIKVYINGTVDTIDVNNDTGSPDDTDNEPSYQIGADDKGNRQFVGEIDDLLVYDNKWLTQKEVTRIYSAGKRSHR